MMNSILSTKLQNVFVPDAQVMTDLHSARNCPLSLCNTVWLEWYSLSKPITTEGTNTVLCQTKLMRMNCMVSIEGPFTMISLFLLRKEILYSILSGGKTRPSGLYNHSNLKLGVGFTCQWSSDKADKRKKNLTTKPYSLSMAWSCFWEDQIAWRDCHLCNWAIYVNGTMPSRLPDTLSRLDTIL